MAGQQVLLRLQVRRFWCVSHDCPVGTFGIDVIVIEPRFVATNLAHAADATPAANSDTNTYAELVRRGDAYLAKELAAARPADRVATEIVDEALRRRPHTRRVLPARGRFTVSLLTTLPDRIADSAKRRVLKLN